MVFQSVFGTYVNIKDTNMFEVVVHMHFCDHRARLSVSSYDISKRFKVEKKEFISKKIDQLVTDACMEINPNITNIQLHEGYHTNCTRGLKSLLFEKNLYDFTNTSDCAILQKWSDQEYHLCKRVAPLKYLSKRNCYAGLLEDVQYKIVVEFDIVEVSEHNN